MWCSFLVSCAICRSFKTACWTSQRVGWPPSSAAAPRAVPRPVACSQALSGRWRPWQSCVAGHHLVLQVWCSTDFLWQDTKPPPPRLVLPCVKDVNQLLQVFLSCCPNYICCTYVLTYNFWSVSIPFHKYVAHSLSAVGSVLVIMLGHKAVVAEPKCRAAPKGASWHAKVTSSTQAW